MNAYKVLENSFDVHFHCVNNICWLTKVVMLSDAF